MPTSKTKELAKKLGLLKKRKAETGAGNGRKRRKGQLLSYVIIIDFESMCWKEKKWAQEIIEFPAVLLDIQTGDVVGEFQQYVQPRENPILSDFCKELTGISQTQVDSGVPLPTCLYLFGKWVRQLGEEREVCLMEPGQQYGSHDANLCALATWSDWDLGVCLQYECRRKQIRKPLYFEQWIDLRIVYKQFYDRKPSGLCGSLEDLGMAFTGREHCGLDDARNTAKLCYRLVKDGCKLNITKSLWKKKEVIRAPKLEAETVKDRGNCIAPSMTQDQCQIITAPNATHSSTTDPEVRQEDNDKGGVQAETTKGEKLHVDESACNTVPAVKEEEWMTINDENFLNEIIHEFEQFEKDYCEGPTVSRSTPQGPCCSNPHVLANHTTATKHDVTPSRTWLVSHIAPVTLLPPSHHQLPDRQLQEAELNIHPSLRQLQTSTSTASATPKMPSHMPTVNSFLQQQQTATCICTSIPSSTKTASHIPTASTCSPQKPSAKLGDIAAVTPSTPSTSFRTPSTVQWVKLKSSQSTSPSLLGSPQPFNGGKITPPLCNCGKRAKRKVVTSPGPNQGKPFFSCPGGRTSGCQYFRWECSSPYGATHTSTVNLSSEYT